MSDTPRTDVELAKWDESPELKVMIRFSRQLERELAAANERIRRLEEQGDRIVMHTSMMDRIGAWERVKNPPCQHCLRVECECSDLDVMPDMGDKS